MGTRRRWGQSGSCQVGSKVAVSVRPGDRSQNPCLPTQGIPVVMVAGTCVQCGLSINVQGKGGVCREVVGWSAGGIGGAVCV